MVRRGYGFCGDRQTDTGGDTQMMEKDSNEDRGGRITEVGVSEGAREQGEGGGGHGPKKEYVYKSTLSRVFGLTPSMIQELGSPDRYCMNPHWRSGPEASLYRTERVEGWVAANKERVEKARASRARRSAAMKAVQDRKRAERFEQATGWARSVEIALQRPLPATLLDDARQCYRFSSHVDPLEGKAVRAYVRHRLTNYDSLRWGLRRHEFGEEVYRLLRERVDAVVEAALTEWKEAHPRASGTASSPSCASIPAESRTTWTDLEVDHDGDADAA
jgi:hypothetical protein